MLGEKPSELLVFLRLLGVAFLVWSAGTSEALAYVRHTTRDGQSTRWHSNPLVFTLFTDRLPPGISREAFVAAASGAAHAWNEQSCSSLRVEVHEAERGGSSNHSLAADGLNAIVVRDRVWCPGGDRRNRPCYSEKEAAVTTTFYGRTSDAGDETLITEADIELNGVDYVWNTGDTESLKNIEEDLQGMIVHEIGHTLGFADSCNTATSRQESKVDQLGGRILDCRNAGKESRISAMNPTGQIQGERRRRSLSYDDALGLCAVYGTPTSAVGRWYAVAFVGSAVILAGVVVGLRRRWLRSR